MIVSITILPPPGYSWDGGGVDGFSPAWVSRPVSSGRFFTCLADYAWWGSGVLRFHARSVRGSSGALHIGGFELASLVNGEWVSFGEHELPDFLRGVDRGKVDKVSVNMVDGVMGLAVSGGGRVEFGWHVGGFWESIVFTGTEGLVVSWQGELGVVFRRGKQLWLRVVGDGFVGEVLVGVLPVEVGVLERSVTAVDESSFIVFSDVGGGVRRDELVAFDGAGVFIVGAGNANLPVAGVGDVVVFPGSSNGVFSGFLSEVVDVGEVDWGLRRRVLGRAQDYYRVVPPYGLRGGGLGIGVVSANGAFGVLVQ